MPDRQTSNLDDAMRGPLSGIRILDITQFLSGPYCTQILADLGAEVIKLESPEGDLARHIPPHFIGQDSVYYLSINRNKKSIALDLKTPAGAKIAEDLALACDAVVENYRPGVLKRLGLDAERLRRQKPSLIWCSLSGFGQSGPYRDKPAYDMIVQALSGGMSLTGEPGRAAVRSGIPIGDICAGLYSAIAVTAALNRRRTTGQGDVIDIAMLDCQAAMLSYQAAYYLHSGSLPARQGSGHDSIPTYRTFTAGDGIDVVVTANTERMWQGLCRALDRRSLIDDDRFADNALRYQNRHELWPVLEEAFRRMPAQHWLMRLEAEQVPVAIVKSLDAVISDPQVHHRNMVTELRRDGRTVRVMGNPIRFSSMPHAEPSFPPGQGEHSDQILAAVLEMPPQEIEALFERGILLNRAAPPAAAAQKTTTRRSRS